jgi:hypothetical protein
MVEMIVTDRSRYKTYFQCPMERFLEYHFTGTGIVKKGTTVPLATGSHGHKAVELILRDHIVTGSIPTESLVRDATNQVSEDYFTEVAEAGFMDQADTERAEFILNEQTTLITGLITAWSQHVLPNFLDNFKVLAVEKEMECILACTCGLEGVGDYPVHVERGCEGIILMTRPDIVARKYETNVLAYVEIKTGSRIDEYSFEGDVQFAFGASGVAGHFGEPLEESYVHALIKGSRPKQYNSATGKFDLPPKQQSTLCYAYVRPGSPPMLKQDIKYRKGKGVTAAYKKTPVWEIEFNDKPEDKTALEHYIALMPDEELESHVNVFGPFPFPAYQVEETMLDLVNVEKKNHEIFCYIDDIINDKGLGHESVQEELREYVPRSWNCRRYGTAICGYYPICMRRNGWDDPLGGVLDYIRRVPNHPLEAQFQV